MLMNAPLLQQLLTTRQDLAALFHKAVAYTIIVIKWTVECRRVVTQLYVLYFSTEPLSDQGLRSYSYFWLKYYILTGIRDCASCASLALGTMGPSAVAREG